METSGQKSKGEDKAPSPFGFRTCHLLYASLLLVYPLLYVAGSAQEFKLFTPASIAALALALCLLKPERLAAALNPRAALPSIPLLAMAAIAFTHFLSQEAWKLEDLCLSLAWIAFPLLAWTRREEYERTLPGFLCLLWTVNLALSVFQLSQGKELSGLPGNWNWNAALTLMTAPFAAKLAYSWLRRGESLVWKALACAGAGAVAALSLALFVRCDSRGAYMAAAATAAFAAFLEAGPKLKRALLTAGAAAAIGISAFFALKGTDAAARMISSDVRIPLWESTVAFIAQNPALGVGQASFENEFAPHRSLEYFFNKNASVRTNHPHNNFLFIASGFGLLGLAAWLLLLVYPLSLLAFSYERLKGRTETKLLLFALVAMTIHAMFDLIFFEWPTAMLSLLILGLIWAKAWPLPEEEEARKTSLPVWPAAFCKTAAALMLAAVALILARDGYARWQARKASSIAGNERLAPIAACFRGQAVAACKSDPALIYRAMTGAYLDARNSDLALRYLEELEGTPCPNFAHSNAYRGKCLAMAGRLSEAAQCYLKECANYPLQAIPLYNLAETYRKMGRASDAANAEAALVAVMKLRGLEMKDLKTMLEKPDLDLKFHKILDERADARTEAAQRAP